MLILRTLGRSGIKVSALGLGCWAIGGPFLLGGLQDGWGDVDDKESIRAMHAAFDLGVNFVDTADAYGVGHSEQVVGQAVLGRRSRMVISTKFGFFGNESTKMLHGVNLDPDYAERACDASLKRLNTDYIDLYLLHVGDISVSQIGPILDALDRLVEKGKIRTYGWSTDLADGAAAFAKRPNCSAIEHDMNVFVDAPEMVALCEANYLASVNRMPLAMGLLSGKFTRDSNLPKDDVRGAGHGWVRYFKDGRPEPAFLKMLDGVRDMLTSGGRTLAQGALCWLWGRSENTIPIPGFKSVKQAEENAKAMAFGPLTKLQMQEIDELLKSMGE
jgi:aryl-alcohol dehydrogenase-like predicted oxidoreductase